MPRRWPGLRQLFEKSGCAINVSERPLSLIDGASVSKLGPAYGKKGERQMSAKKPAGYTRPSIRKIKLKTDGTKTVPVKGHIVRYGVKTKKR